MHTADSIPQIKSMINVMYIHYRSICTRIATVAMSCDTLCSSMHAAPDTGLASYQQLLQWTSQSTVTQAATWPARSNHINPLASALQCHIISFCNLIPFLTSCMGSSQTPIVSEQSGSMTILKPLTCIWQLSSVPKHTLKCLCVQLVFWRGLPCR